MQDDTSLFPHFHHAYGSDILPFLIEIFRSIKDSPDEIIEYYTNEISNYYKNPEEQYKIGSIRTIMRLISACYQEPAILELSVSERQMDI